MSVGGVEGLLDGGGDAAAVGDLVAVAARPVPDRDGVLPVGCGALRCAGGGAAAASAGAAGVIDPGRQVLPQGGGVLGVEVDLVVGAVQAEGDGLVGGEGVVEVVDQGGGGLLGPRLNGSFREDAGRRNRS